MTWKLTSWARTRAGVTGVPWRDLDDEEYERVAAQFPPGALHPYFEREPGPPAPAGEEIASGATLPYFEPEEAVEPAPPSPEPAPAPRARKRRRA